MVIIPSTPSNAFSAMETLASVVRIASADGKVPEVTSERITKRYAEIFLCIDAVVGSCGAIGVDQAMAEVRATLESINPGSNAGPISKPVRPTILPLPYANNRRTLSSQTTQISSLAFSSPAFGFKPLPGFEPPQQLAKILKQGNKATFTPMAMDAPAPKEKSDPWADLFGPISDGEVKSAEAEAAAKATAMKAAEPPPPPPPPPPPTRPLLELHETWRAEGKGGRILRCGLDGGVKWVEDAAKHPPCTVKFSLSPSPLYPATRDALSRSSRSTLATSLDLTSSSPQSLGSIIVDPSSARANPPIDLLSYHIPPSASLKAPLLAHIGFSMQDLTGRDVPTVAVIVGVRVAIAQDPRLRFQGATIRVLVPETFGLPSRVSPPGAVFDGKASKLSWDVPGEVLFNGCVEVAAAAFFVQGAESKDLISAVKGGLVAEVELLGANGGGETISGITLVQEPPSLANLWRATMITRP